MDRVGVPFPVIPLVVIPGLVPGTNGGTVLGLVPGTSPGMTGGEDIAVRQARRTSGQREFPIAPVSRFVGTRAVGWSAAAVAGNDAGILAFHVSVDPGHPGIDLVGEQSDAARLDMVGPD